MKRSPLIIGIIALQLLLALFWCGLSLYLLWLTHAPETLQASDPAAAALGLEIAAAVTAPPGLLGLVAAHGLYANKLWGWWLTLLTNAALFLVLGYSMMDDGWHNLDPEVVAFTALSLLPMILLLLPPVCRYYWKHPSVTLPSANLETPRP